MDQYSGILPVNKEEGLTSHDVVNQLRRIVGQKKIGHTGTLDPMATGLLLICFGRATRLSQFMTDWDKTYRAEVTLGKVSDTFDADGRIENSGTVPPLNKAELKKILKRFRGEIRQKVPAYSAIKVRGRKLYSLARRGEKIELPERTVRINSLRLLGINRTGLVIEVDCSKGTYIRSLADDIGREIGCGGYLSALERTRLGPFSIEDAVSLAEVASLQKSHSLEMALRPIERVLDFPMISFRKRAADAIQHGTEVTTDDILNLNGDFSIGDLISLADEKGRILAIAKIKCGVDRLKSEGVRDFYSFVRVLV